MRRFVVALVVVALSLSLVGCGGGGEAEAPPAGNPPAASTPPPPPPGAKPAGEEDTADRTPLELVDFAAFPDGSGSTDATGLPEEVRERLESKQPMLLFFYDKSQKTADDQREEIDAVLDEYRGTIDLLAYDIGQKLDDKKHDDKDAQAVSLARALEIEFTPYIVMVDEQGLITWRYRGYIDRAIIEREVLRATD